MDDRENRGNNGSKESDLLKIHDEIKHFLTDVTNDTIKDTLFTLDRIIRPTNKMYAQSKRNLIAHLKKHLFNNKNLAIDAKKYTDLKIHNNKHKNKFKNILKEGYTIEDIDREIKKKSRTMNLKKELAKDLLGQLKEINETEYVSLIKLIEGTSDINTINIILRMLNKSFCFANTLSILIIEKQIKKEAMIERIIFNNY